MADVVLAVFAHPDDETLACGGTLARHAREGATVRVLTFTDGVSSRGKDPDAAATRRREYEAACGTLGAEIVTPVREPDGFPDQQLETVPLTDLSRIIAAVIVDTDATTVYTHWLHDLNADHRRVAEAVLVATRPVAGSTVRRVLAAEVPESTSQAFGAPAFAPTVFVALRASDIEAKASALTCYASERRAWPHLRSVAAVQQRAAYWGGVAGVAAAEALVLLREVR